MPQKCYLLSAGTAVMIFVAACAPCGLEGDVVTVDWILRHVLWAMKRETQASLHLRGANKAGWIHAHSHTCTLNKSVTNSNTKGHYCHSQLTAGLLTIHTEGIWGTLICLGLKITIIRSNDWSLLTTQQYDVHHKTLRKYFSDYTLS